MARTDVTKREHAAEQARRALHALVPGLLEQPSQAHRRVATEFQAFINDTRINADALNRLGRLLEEVGNVLRENAP